MDANKDTLGDGTFLSFVAAYWTILMTMDAYEGRTTAELEANPVLYAALTMETYYMRIAGVVGSVLVLLLCFAPAFAAAFYVLFFVI